MSSTQQCLVVAKVTRHGQDMVLDIAKIEADLGFGRHVPLLGTAFGEAFDDVGFVTKEAVEAHHFLAAVAYLTEHVDARRTLFSSGLTSFFIVDGVRHAIRPDGIGMKLKDFLIDVIDFVFNRLNKWLEDIGNIIDDGIGDPVGAKD